MIEYLIRPRFSPIQTVFYGFTANLLFYDVILALIVVVIGTVLMSLLQCLLEKPETPHLSIK